MRQVMIGVTEARDQLKNLVEQIDDRDIVVLRHNRPVAIMVAPSRLEELLDRIEDLEDTISVLEHHASDEPLVPFEDVVAQLQAEDDEAESVPDLMEALKESVRRDTQYSSRRAAARKAAAG
jgi:PHD/YefM family antitoxin component YafN of YafNO toxin-antitoxin module